VDQLCVAATHSVVKQREQAELRSRAEHLESEDAQLCSEGKSD
jgi:hypothetical protein